MKNFKTLSRFGLALATLLTIQSALMQMLQQVA